MSRCYTHPTTRLGRSAKHGGVGHGLDEYRRNGSCSWRRRFDGLLHHGEAMLLALTAGVGATVALSVSGSSLLGLLLNWMDVAADGQDRNWVRILQHTYGDDPSAIAALGLSCSD